MGTIQEADDGGRFGDGSVKEGALDSDPDRRVTGGGVADRHCDSDQHEVWATSAAVCGSGGIAGDVLCVWVVGGARGRIAVCSARSAGGSGCDADLYRANTSSTGTVGVRDCSWAETAGRRGWWGGGRAAEICRIGDYLRTSSKKRRRVAAKAESGRVPGRARRSKYCFG